MRIRSASCWLGLVLVAAGCSSRPEGGGPRGPLLSGSLETGTFWSKPLTASSNEGSGFNRGSRVELYEQFVVVTPEGGLSYVYPSGQYSGLIIRRD